MVEMIRIKNTLIITFFVMVSLFIFFFFDPNKQLFVYKPHGSDNLVLNINFYNVAYALSKIIFWFVFGYYYGKKYRNSYSEGSLYPKI